MRKTVVAFAASAAFERNESFFVIKEVGNDLAAFRVAYYRADWHFYNEIRSSFAGAIFCFPVASVLGAIKLLEFEINKRIDFFVCDEHDISSVAAVTAVGTAVRHKFFAMERNFAVAAVACFNKNFYIV